MLAKQATQTRLTEILVASPDLVSTPKGATPWDSVKVIAKEIHAHPSRSGREAEFYEGRACHART
jgi:hypothetical protein